MKVNVLSGKGGVGKSSVAASLAVLLSKKHDMICVDCDVDTPNLGLFFGLQEKDFTKKEVSTGSKAVLIEHKCIKCGNCLDKCVFSAISGTDKPSFNRFLCEGCGACQLACPVQAIALNPTNNGWIGHAEAKNFPIVGGQLGVGESGSGDIVSEVKKQADLIAQEREIEWSILDSAAGIGCPVIASITGSDYVIAVTEPTPAALSDLKKALLLVEHFGIPYGIVINKASLNPKMGQQIKDFTKKLGAPILAELPYDRAFIDALVNFKPVVEWKKELETEFGTLVDNLLAEL